MEIIIIGYMLGLYRDNGKENGNYFFTHTLERWNATAVL